MLNVIVEGLFALFAAVGVATVVWIVIGIFIGPDGCEGASTYTVIKAEGSDKNVEKAVKSLLWWQDMMPEEREIIVCGDIGSETRERLEFIEKQHYRLTVLDSMDLGEYLKKRMS